MFRYRNIRVILMTFTLGLALTQFLDYLHEGELNERPQKAVLVTPMDAAAIPEFRATMRACGMGRYGQSYLSRDGAQLFEGTNVCDEPNTNTDTILFKERRKVAYTTLVSGQMVARIYKYPYGHCIEAPSIELATSL